MNIERTRQEHLEMNEKLRGIVELLVEYLQASMALDKWKEEHYRDNWPLITKSQDTYNAIPSWLAFIIENGKKIDWESVEWWSAVSDEYVKLSNAGKRGAEAGR